VTQSKLQIHPERVRKLVLVRVLVTRKSPITLTQLEKSVCTELGAHVSAADAKRAFDAALREAEQLASLKLATPPKSKSPRPALTETGRQQALSALGLKALPPKLDWSQARKMLAVQVLAPAQAASQPLTADAIATQILVAQHGLPASVATLAQAIERLAWRALDVETDAPFTAAAVQRHLLRELVPADARATGSAWRRMFAMRAIHANGHTADALARALLLSDGLQPGQPQQARPPQQRDKRPGVGNDNAPVRPEQPSLTDFARAVARAAHSPQVLRFHGDRAFIGSVWEHMRASKLIGDMSLDEFKSNLVSAHRKQLLEIVRADLVGAMDPNEVRRSEARHDNATYHFVALNAGGAR
jgi:hypothetical protein